MGPMASTLLALTLAMASAPLPAAGALLASPIGAQPEPAAPWRPVGLPGASVAATRFAVTDLEGERALRVEAQASYGNLVHPLEAGTGGRLLRWQWRVDRASDQTDLRRKDGDDVPLKVCALFSLPLAAVPFAERQLLRLARLRTGEPLPAASVCYVWDRHLAPGTTLDNVYSRRVRQIVLRGPETPLRAWVAEQRDVVADFLRLFGDETDAAVPLAAISIGADADNTRAHSLAYLRALSLEAGSAR